MKVRLSESARCFLREEARYLRRYSPAAAKRLLASLEAAKANLSLFPQMGPDLDQSPVADSRRLVLGDYILNYEIEENGVAITSIRHGRMKPATVIAEDDCDYEVRVFDDSGSKR